MYRRIVMVAVVLAVGLSASTVLAQCACGAAAVSYVPTYTSYYAPSVAYYARPNPM